MNGINKMLLFTLIIILVFLVFRSVRLTQAVQCLRTKPDEFHILWLMMNWLLFTQFSYRTEGMRPFLRPDRNQLKMAIKWELFGLSCKIGWIPRNSRMNGFYCSPGLGYWPREPFLSDQTAECTSPHGRDIIALINSSKSLEFLGPSVITTRI